MTINVALAGAGAFGIKHLDAINHITSSIPSLPASRTYSTCGTCASAAG